MSEVIECAGHNGRVCIRDGERNMLFTDRDTWTFLQEEYGLSADTEGLLTKIREILRSAAEPGSRLTHEW